jgi:hypothetical protein
MAEESDNKSLDVFGLGKLAKAIPPKVYERTAATLLQTFQQVTAPITATTEGLGRYLRQKFDNMVDAEKAIAVYTLEQAVDRVRARGAAFRPPGHPKTFVRTIEEASKETDPLLHEMWANLLASQISTDASHPHFVQALSHLSATDARLLISLLPKSDIGENDGGYLYATIDASFTHWIPKAGAEERPWTPSCTLLCHLFLADVMAPKARYEKEVTILYRSATGSAFIAAVTEPANQ